MRHFVCLVILSLSIAITAQMGMDPSAMMRKMMTSTGRLMGQNDFKKELKLSGDQNKKVSELAKNHDKGTQEITKKAEGAGGDLSATMSIMAELDTLDSETDKAIQAELTPEQSRRLTQIKWQIVGVKAIYDPALQKELDLTQEQISKLEEWRKGESGRMMSLMQANGNPNKIKGARKKMKDDDESTIMGILLPEQVTKYKAALGPECKAAKRLSELLF